MLSDLTGANFFVDWKTLEAASISRQTPITATLHDVAMRKVLSLILTQAAGGDTLTFYLEDNVIQITTRDEADKKLVTVVYDVRDLISLDDNFDPTLPSVSLSGGGGGGGGGGSSSAVSGAAGTTSSGTAADRATKLIKLIESSVRPEIWRDNGTTGTANIDYFDGKLIITAPRSVQEAIGGYLD